MLARPRPVGPVPLTTQVPPRMARSTGSVHRTDDRPVTSRVTHTLPAIMIVICMLVTRLFAIILICGVHLGYYQGVYHLLVTVLVTRAPLFR